MALKLVDGGPEGSSSNGDKIENCQDHGGVDRQAGKHNQGGTGELP
jgi:hypothetical protein